MKHNSLRLFTRNLPSTCYRQHSSLSFPGSHLLPFFTLQCSVSHKKQDFFPWYCAQNQSLHHKCQIGTSDGHQQHIKKYQLITPAFAGMNVIAISGYKPLTCRRMKVRILLELVTTKKNKKLEIEIHYKCWSVCLYEGSGCVIHWNILL